VRDIVKGEIVCSICGVAQPPAEGCRCCGAPLHSRVTGSIGKVWGYSLTAFFWLIPANLLPMMKVVKLGKVYQSTILEGVINFIHNGEYFIGGIIFIASILIPFFKLGVLWFLLLIPIVPAFRSYRKVGIALYRFISFIGKYSMLDVFVVVFMVSFVQFGELVRIEAGPAVVPFGLGVIFTILATKQLDSRLLWDR